MKNLQILRNARLHSASITLAVVEMLDRSIQLQRIEGFAMFKIIILIKVDMLRLYPLGRSGIENC